MELNTTLSAASKKKHWYTSKLVWLAILQAIAGVVVIFATKYPDIGGIIIGKSVIDIILRFITELPIE